MRKAQRQLFVVYMFLYTFFCIIVSFIFLRKKTKQLFMAVVHANDYTNTIGNKNTNATTVF